jgi:DNA repair exonuclease SbcCD ATPase subunit
MDAAQMEPKEAQRERILDRIKDCAVAIAVGKSEIEQRLREYHAITHPMDCAIQRIRTETQRDEQEMESLQKRLMDIDYNVSSGS